MKELWSKLTPLAKIIMIGVMAGILYVPLKFTGVIDRLLPSAKTKTASVPPKAYLPPVVGESSYKPAANVAFTPPSETPAAAHGAPVRFLVWAWNSQMGLMLANGGPETTRGSLMDRQGVSLNLIRQDDTTKMQEALTAFAQELKNGNPNPTAGAHFVAIMGDGSASFLKGLNDTLRKLGPEYMAKVVGSCGYSRGEDKFMGPAAWKENPQAARGGMVAGVLRDGDWNIALKWCGDNGIPNNPDEKTYDPGALNWVAAKDYVDASEKYISGYSEERVEVRNGKPTGKKVKIAVNGVVTWTPGDVTVAHKKGGLVSVVSTREYASQMPNTIIGIDKWMRANRQTVEGMLSGIADGGEQVRGSAQGLHAAAEISARVYNEEDAEYWERYYKGVIETDAQGQDVELGGSSVNTLADSVLLFGLAPGSANLFQTTYTVFAEVAKQQYPELMGSYYPAAQITDVSYLKAVASRKGGLNQQIAASRPRYMGNAQVKRVVSRKSWHITFQTGSAQFTPDAKRVVDKLRQDLLIAGGTLVQIHGHTDNVGNSDANMALSEARAFAVKQYLERSNPVNFPSGRIRVYAHGQTNPVAPNGSEAGRAQNRRVEIVLGTG
jgi:OOP family OmpA-OmpF porin